MRNKSGLFKQIISFLTALVVMCGMVLPSTITANAANALPIAQYITVSGTVSGVAGSNNGTYNGEWKASAIYLLLLINPILSIVSGLIYGKLQGFDWLILWFVAFLFIPVIYFRMDGQWDCMIYPGIYSILMGLGMVVGKIFQKK